MACSTSLVLALSALCALSQLRVCAGWHHQLADISGKWGVESYFQAGDTLSFGRHAESTGVHEVTREQYVACKVGEALKSYTGRDSVARLDAAKTYYFVSGDRRLCAKGRRLMVVVVLATPATPPAAAPPVTTPPAAPTPAPTPATIPASPVPAPPPSPASSPSSSSSPSPSPTSSSPPAPPPPPPGPVQPPAPAASDASSPPASSLLTSFFVLCTALLVFA